MARPRLTGVSAALALLLAGCAVPDAVQDTGPGTKAGFPAAEFAWSAQPGTASVDGTASIRTPEGDLHTCAGHDVVLSPRTDYTLALLTASRAREDPWQPVEWHSEYERFRRKARCKGAGTFRFVSLPPGRWFVLAPVFWETSAGRYNVYQGAYLHGEVETGTGGTTRVILTAANRF